MDDDDNDNDKDDNGHFYIYLLRYHWNLFIEIFLFFEIEKKVINASIWFLKYFSWVEEWITTTKLW